VIDSGTVSTFATSFPDLGQLVVRTRETTSTLADHVPDLGRLVAIMDTVPRLFTSGSTGQPRAVVFSRDALVAAAEAHAAHLGWRDDDRWLLCLPLGHAGGMSIVIRCLLARRPIVWHPGKFDAPAIVALARQHRATLASVVPTQLAALLDAGLERGALRAVLVGGAAAPRSLLAAALARGIPVLPTYGLTETFGQIATALPGSLDLVPLPGVSIVAGTCERPAPIRIRGPMLATRYDDGTPIAPELETRDLGHVDARGLLHVVGRADDVIITGGENVHPTAVEAVLAATPGVRAACVFGVADPRWGQIVAAALATDPSFDPACARARWHAALPAHARPRRIATLGALPALPSGKPDRRAISALPTQPILY
jgi:O-succinylbenzoic acid--CoA ligase